MANWTAHVCDSRANRVVIIAGPSKDDSQVIGQWHQGDGTRSYELPGSLQGLQKVFVRFETPGQSGAEAQTNACVKFRGHAKKAYSFDDGEDHNVDANDDNDGDCVC